jgi:WD40 repeat protein
MDQGVQEALRDPKTASPAATRLPDDGQQPETAPGSPTSRSPDAIWVATDEFGDSLPPHATMRLGTVRFRQQDEVTDIAYSIDGKTIATLDENEVLLWDAATGRLKQRLKPSNPPPGFRPVSLAFSPNGHEIAVSGGMGVIIIWDLETGVELVRIESEHQRIPFRDTDLSYSPDGRRLAVTAGGSAAVYDTISGDKLHSLTIPDHRAAFSGIAWSPDGKHIVAGILKPSAVAWNAESGAVVRTFQTGKERAFTRDVQISDDGLSLYASSGGSVYEWDFESGRLLREIETGGDFIVRFYVDRNAEQLIAGCQDGITRIWDLWEDLVSSPIISFLVAKIS